MNIWIGYECKGDIKYFIRVIIVSAVLESSSKG